MGGVKAAQTPNPAPILLVLAALGWQSQRLHLLANLMRNLNSTPSSWEIEKLNSDLKVHSLEQELEKLKKECNGLRKELQKHWLPANGNCGAGEGVFKGKGHVEPLAHLCLGAVAAAGCFWDTALSAVPGQAGSLPLHPCCAADRELPEDQGQELNLLNGDLLQKENIQRKGWMHRLEEEPARKDCRLLRLRDTRIGKSSGENVQQAYWELKREMSNLHLVTEVQAEVLRKLKTPTATKKGNCLLSPASTCAPVQCVEDVEKNLTKLYLTSSGAVYKKTSLSQNDKLLCNAIAPPLSRDVKILSEQANLQSWTDERPMAIGSTTCHEQNSYGKSSLEDNSWVFPSPPKPSETMFWEMKNKSSLSNYPIDYLDQCNQNCLHKS
ncbi:5-azacytidine-induced protein 2 [Chelonia mydas]|uniref:5-azacytidine-induced protein 2 n=1 Tax=Chelonia mydas TaxID=8469 RepID=M7BH81_CHEMY|nr:5-azacytidine-induced protein 2 [Chelonia mydas]